jgi:hypothetical protein
MERFNNWMSYSFNNEVINGAKPAINSTFKLHFKKNYQYQDMSYYDALFYNARMMKDSYSEPFDVLFSGGIDSEIAIRAFKKEGVRFNVYTIRLENDINIQDVTAAVKIADNIGVKLNIIDWNLQKFLENDAIEMFNKTFCPHPSRMLRHAWYDLLDNIPVMGEGEPYWKRELGLDYSKKSQWYLHWCEDYFTGAIYANTVGRKVISEWYNYTPEIVMSFHKLPLIQKLLNDEIKGKVSCWSSRTDIHKVLWDDIYYKPKLVGYEGLTGEPGTNPEMLTTFHNNFSIHASNQEYKFTETELESIFLN